MRRKSLNKKSLQTGGQPENPVNPAIQDLIQSSRSAIDMGATPKDLVLELSSSSINDEDIQQVLISLGYTQDDVQAIYSEIQEEQQKAQEEAQRQLQQRQQQNVTAARGKEVPIYAGDRKLGMSPKGDYIVSVKEPFLDEMKNIGKSYQHGGNLPQAQFGTLHSLDGRTTSDVYRDPRSWYKNLPIVQPENPIHLAMNLMSDSAFNPGKGLIGRTLSRKDRDGDKLMDGAIWDRKAKKARRKLNKGNLYDYTFYDRYGAAPGDKGIKIDMDSDNALSNEMRKYAGTNYDLYNAAKKGTPLRSKEQFDKDVTKHSKIDFDPESGNYYGYAADRELDPALFSKNEKLREESLGRYEGMTTSLDEWRSRFSPEQKDNFIQQIQSIKDAPEGTTYGVDKEGFGASYAGLEDNPYLYDTMMGLNMENFNRPVVETDSRPSLDLSDRTVSDGAPWQQTQEEAAPLTFKQWYGQNADRLQNMPKQEIQDIYDSEKQEISEFDDYQSDDTSDDTRTSDNTYNFIDDINTMLDYEGKAGGFNQATGKAYGLSNLGANRYTDLDPNDPNFREDLVARIEQDYGPLIEGFPDELKGAALDFYYNTGKNPNIYMLDQYIRGEYGEELENRSDFAKHMKDGQWDSEGWKKGFEELYGQHASALDSLNSEDKLKLLNEGRSFYYNNINRVNNAPNPAADATWLKRPFFQPEMKTGGKIKNNNMRQLPRAQMAFNTDVVDETNKGSRSRLQERLKAMPLTSVQQPLKGSGQYFNSIQGEIAGKEARARNSSGDQVYDINTLHANMSPIPMNKWEDFLSNVNRGKLKSAYVYDDNTPVNKETAGWLSSQGVSPRVPNLEAFANLFGASSGDLGRSRRGSRSVVSDLPFRHGGVPKAQNSLSFKATDRIPWSFPTEEQIREDAKKNYYRDAAGNVMSNFISGDTWYRSGAQAKPVKVKLSGPEYTNLHADSVYSDMLFDDPRGISIEGTPTAADSAAVQGSTDASRTFMDKYYLSMEAWNAEGTDRDTPYFQAIRKGVFHEPPARGSTNTYNMIDGIHRTFNPFTGSIAGGRGPLAKFTNPAGYLTRQAFGDDNLFELQKALLGPAGQFLNKDKPHRRYGGDLPKAQNNIDLNDLDEFDRNVALYKKFSEDKPNSGAYDRHDGAALKYSNWAAASDHIVDNVNKLEPYLTEADAYKEDMFSRMGLSPEEIVRYKGMLGNAPIGTTAAGHGDTAVSVAPNFAAGGQPFYDGYEGMMSDADIQRVYAMGGTVEFI